MRVISIISSKQVNFWLTLDATEYCLRQHILTYFWRLIIITVTLQKIVWRIILAQCLRKDIFFAKFPKSLLFHSYTELFAKMNGEISPQQRHFTNDLEARHQSHFTRLSLMQLHYIQTIISDKARDVGNTPNKQLKSSEKYARSGSHGEWRCRRHHSRTRNVPYKSRPATRLIVP